MDPFSGSGYYNLFINITTEAYEDGSFYGLAFTLPGTSSINGTLPGPSDNGYTYYRVVVHANQKLIVRLIGPIGTDFDLYIYDSNLQQIGSSTLPFSFEYTEVIVSSTGYYYIVVVPYSGSGDFTLEIEVGDILFPLWLLILIICLIIIAILVAIGFYIKLRHKTQDTASDSYEFSDLY